MCKLHFFIYFYTLPRKLHRAFASGCSSSRKVCHTRNPTYSANTCTVCTSVASSAFPTSTAIRERTPGTASTLVQSCPFSAYIALASLPVWFSLPSTIWVNSASDFTKFFACIFASWTCSSCDGTWTSIWTLWIYSRLSSARMRATRY